MSSAGMRHWTSATPAQARFAVELEQSIPRQPTPLERALNVIRSWFDLGSVEYADVVTFRIPDAQLETCTMEFQWGKPITFHFEGKTKPSVWMTAGNKE